MDEIDYNTIIQNYFQDNENKPIEIIESNRNIQSTKEIQEINFSQIEIDINS